MTASLRIVFAGTPAFGLPCLDAIHTSPHQLIALYTQPDRPAGRGRKLQESAVKTWGQQHHISIYQPLNFKDQSTKETLASLTPDLMVVIAYGLILPREVLAIPRLGCINVHASLLPRWRGASPIQQSILAGDNDTGITIMQMDAGMDTGDALNTQSMKIKATDTAASLHHQLSQLAAAPLLATLEDISLGRAIPIAQDSAQATYAPKIKKQDAAINWHQPAACIDRQIRGYYPWPIAFTHMADLTYRIHAASVVSTPTQHPAGTILAIDHNGILVATTSDAILITTIQCPGGRPIAIADYLNGSGHGLKVGSILQ